MSDKELKDMPIGEGMVGMVPYAEKLQSKLTAADKLLDRAALMVECLCECGDPGMESERCPSCSLITDIEQYRKETNDG